MHLRGKAMASKRSYRTARADDQFVKHFQFNWMNNYEYTDDSAPLLPKGTISGHGVARQHARQTKTTRIRLSGWAVVTAASTRWRMPGST